MNLMYFDGAPCAVKAACTVLSGGKSGDHFKGLPIAIIVFSPYIRRISASSTIFTLKPIRHSTDSCFSKYKPEQAE